MLLLLFSILSLFIYYTTNGAGMIFDFNGWALLYEQGNFNDVWTCFGYPGLHQMEHLFFYSFYKVFHLNTTAWYILFSLLHACCTYLGYLFIKKWMSTCQFDQSQLIALASSLLFLISPFAVDTVINKVTIHYLLSVATMLSSLYFLVIYYKNRKEKYIIGTCFLFIFALFSIELAYIFPFLMLFVWLSLHWFNQQLDFSMKNVALMTTPFLILASYLLLHKIVIGVIIGHYGANVHLAFDIKNLFSNTIRYFASYIAFFDFWNYKYKIFAHEALINLVYILIPFSIASFILVLFLSLKFKQRKIQLALFLFTFSILALAPILSLYFYDLFPITNDRYSYFAAIFIYAFIVTVISTIKWRNIRHFLLVTFLFINLFFLKKNIKTAADSGTLTWSLLDDFRWFDKDVIFLNMPVTYDGANLFGSLVPTSSFSESLYLHTGIDRRKNIDVVYEMNFSNLSDGVSVKEINPHHYQIEMNQWGGWFWKNLQGASSFENEDMKVNLTSNVSYNIQIKETAKDKIIVYSDGTKWHKFKN